MPSDRWHQHNITFVDRSRAQLVIAERLAPALITAEAAGQLSGWWFMNKQPWPLRYRADEPAPVVESLLDDLVGEGSVVSWRPGTYEPETDAFGGQAAMDAAHELFHSDSHHLMAYQPGPKHLGRRETVVLLVSSMLRGAGLDWFEQGDVWSKVAALRPATDPLPAERAAELAPAVRKLMTADARSLCHPGGPFHRHDEWVTAFERMGAALADLADHGGLTRGLRAVLAHHVIFHANRAGLLRDDQSALFNIAREVVMGTSDNTASLSGAATDVDSVGAVNTDTITTDSAEAERLRNALVDQIRANGHARTAAVETALRTVPRHAFVPDASLEDAYANAPVHIKYDTDGTSISCASQPGVVALMLDQLDVRPGDRVLELGAGSGYNAALLAHLVGEHGHVTTLDVDDDLVEGARAHLTAAGITNVEAVTRDGALGYAEGAPYDRIIATVGAHGVPHAWLEQLAPGGRLLVPQRLKGSVARSIAYEQCDGRWVSLGSEMNTFMPLRRGIADDDRRVIPLSAEGTVRLQAPAGQDIDADALARVLEQPRTEEWTGMTVRAMESPEWMELFLTCSLPSGLIRMLFPQSAKGGLLTEDPYPSSTAAVDQGAVTYLARRLLEKRTPEGGKLWEFGVIGHGPGSDELAATVADTIRTWDREYRCREATFEIQPFDAPSIEQRPGLFALDTPLNRIVVDWR
ncbi:MULTISPECIES: methyltransferase, FxLD system [Streptomyces]|uniref:Protein-L-isoaspartate O-methyltransferase n=1 Tax=Streptomyces tsukubensis (strain DSM 42081 / NBRC 108919 / NRRL 18488 / 9993) TaxID=1114943 RepID=I2N382_STRT9|nr:MULTISPECIES: methyltransferase, FxLD system [Streptomyces]AZK95600.1 methyltransferase, FxLD system [Streptomyces tsukubensis]EIF91479.1 O-methyltransferase [Streptomyces tsukubensis NRRL18488]MYS68448.1 methyltransferase, FxLD system [Streptomyces sp. SID5473]QKM68363.1 methyltransferase, FxLD system [Streptomyces tsukubensis NRRL18488]TAI43180.1 methyltransferase, FxLD system [Streptomyces tsukubensis]